MSGHVTFDSKIAVLLRDDLAGWQRMNVTAFLSSGIAGALPELLGEPYADGDGTAYLAMFRQPVLVLAGTPGVLSASHSRAVARALPMSVFTDELFRTGNDHDNRAAVSAVARSDLRLAGLGLFGPRNVVDRAVKGSRLHR